MRLLGKVAKTLKGRKRMDVRLWYCGECGHVVARANAPELVCACGALHWLLFGNEQQEARITPEMLGEPSATEE